MVPFERSGCWGDMLSSYISSDRDRIFSCTYGRWFPTENDGVDFTLIRFVVDKSFFSGYVQDPDPDGTERTRTVRSDPNV